MRMEITVTGRSKRGTKIGKATRVLARARSKEFVMDNVDQLRSAMKVGLGGHHHVVIRDENGSELSRTFYARRYPGDEPSASAWERRDAAIAV